MALEWVLNQFWHVPLRSDFSENNSAWVTSHFVHSAMLWAWSANPDTLHMAGWSQMIASKITHTNRPDIRVSLLVCQKGCNLPSGDDGVGTRMPFSNSIIRSSTIIHKYSCIWSVSGSFGPGIIVGTIKFFTWHLTQVRSHHWLLMSWWYLPESWRKVSNSKWCSATRMWATVARASWIKPVHRVTLSKDKDQNDQKLTNLRQK